MRSSRAPGEGERAAIGGYHYQYALSAEVIVKHLHTHGFDRIYIADPDAKKLDDFQVESSGRLDAYQFKYSGHAGNITFNGLTSASKGEPSLIKQLAEGWLHIKSTKGVRRVVVHLVTNDIPSVHDSIHGATSALKSSHFSAFIEQAWKPVKLGHRTVDETKKDGWSAHWDKLQQVSGLSAQQFAEFINDCELTFGYSKGELPEASSRNDQAIRQDIEAVRHFLFDAVGDASQIIKLEFHEFLRHIGWSDRNELFGKHQFPVEEQTYEPIVETVDELTGALDNINSGFILLSGPPGSGKSTLLSKTAWETNHRVIKYYSYIPRSLSNSSRGESTSFYHDVLTMLRRNGIISGFSTGRADRDLLKEQFSKALLEIHNTWKTSKLKTIIIIDGLDHIEREQNPSHPLYLELPQPDEVPDGVIFVLGTQRAEFLPPRIRAHVQETGRSFSIKGLDKDAVFQILSKADLSLSLTTQQREKVFSHCSGLPLALMVLIGQLRSVISSPEAVEETLGAFNFDGTNIESNYESYWSTIENDSELRTLLARLCRIRLALDLKWIESWSKVETVDKLRATCHCYFKKDRQSKWYFFHNSFRIFLRQKTATIPGEGFSEERDRRIHAELSQICQKSERNSIWSWEEIYHLVKSGEAEKAIGRFSQEMVRQQLLLGRSLVALKEDFNLLFQNLRASHGVSVLTRYFMIGTEINLRGYFLSDIPIEELHALTGSSEMALSYAVSGNELLIKNERALELSTMLLRNGSTEEACKLFYLSEPSELYAGNVIRIESHRSKDKEILATWAETAPLFRNAKEIFNKIQTLQFLSQQFGDCEWEDISKQEQNYLLYTALRSLIEVNRHDDVEEFLKTLSLLDEWQFGLWKEVNLCIIGNGLSKPDKAKAEASLASLLGAAFPSDKRFGDSNRVDIARALILLRNDTTAALEWVKDVPQPKLRRSLYSDSGNLQQFSKRIKLNRVLNALGIGQRPDKIIPDSSDPNLAGLIGFERALCDVAEIAGAAWIKKELSQMRLEVLSKSLITLFNVGYPETRGWDSWSAIEKCRAEFFEFLITAIAKHYPKSFSWLEPLFSDQWKDPDLSKFWPTELQRSVVLSLRCVGAPRDWVVSNLERIQARIASANGDADGILRDYEGQLRTWVKVGELDRAKECLQIILSRSLAIYPEKDDQLTHWIDWIGFANSTDPANASDRFKLLVCVITQMKDLIGPSQYKDASTELVKQAFSWCPQTALKLTAHLDSMEVSDFDDQLLGAFEIACADEHSDNDTLWTIFTHFILPVGKRIQSQIFSLLLTKLHGSKGVSEFKELLADLVSEISITASQFMRPGYLNDIAETLLKLGEVDLADSLGVKVSPKESQQVGQTLKLKDGTECTLEDLCKDKFDVQECLSLMEDEQESSFFSWHELLERKKIEITSSDLEVLEKAPAQKGYRDVEFLEALAQQHLSYGSKDNAWRLAKTAFDKGEGRGWSIRSDGGSRLRILRFLKGINDTDATKIAWQAITDELDSDSMHVVFTSSHLRDIVTILESNPDWPDLWESIEDFLRQLAPDWEKSAFEFDFPKEKSSYPKGAAFVEWVLDHLDHPVHVLSHAAQRTILELLRSSSSYDQLVQEISAKRESLVERLLMLIEALCEEDPKCLKRFDVTLSRLATTPSASLRIALLRLSRLTGKQLLEKSAIVKPIPQIYELALPDEEEEDFDDSDVIPGEPLPDRTSPAQITALLLPSIKRLSSICDLAEAKIQFHIVQMVKSHGDWPKCSQAFERKFKSKLDSSGLDLPYVRPRADLIRRGFDYVVGELIDAGFQNIMGDQILTGYLRRWDAHFLNERPVKRPLEIANVDRGTDNYFSHKKWVPLLSENHLSLLPKQLANGWAVLGERSELMPQERTRPDEIRTSNSVIEDGKPVNPMSSNHSFKSYQVINEAYEDYEDIAIGKSSRILVIENFDYGFCSPGGRWLALNPQIAKQLGWQRDPSQLFAWKSSSGTPMVQSIWWKDGVLENEHPVTKDSEIGDGWLVIASPDAIKELHSAFKVVVRYERMERIVRTSDQGVFESMRETKSRLFS